MKWFREIKSVGLRDWFWFVIRLRRNEFHRSLDIDKWFDKTKPHVYDSIGLMRARNRAHNIDNKLSEIVS